MRRTDDADRRFHAPARPWHAATAVIAAASICLFVAQPQAMAMVVRGGDGSGNTTTPVDDPGWANVGLCGSGTAVYLGNGWVITASHVGANSVTFGSTTYTVASGTYQRLHDPSSSSTLADLCVFQLSTIPTGLTSVTIGDSSPVLGSMVTAIGYGRNRATSATSWYVDIDTNPYTWSETPFSGYDAQAGGFKTTSTRTKRWGENAISGSETLSGSYGTTRMLKTTFDASGSANEFQGIAGDSGGALFWKNGSDWELAGIVLSVGTFSGQPGSTAVYGNVTYMADLALYRDQILAITAVPEPATLTLLATAAAAILLRRHRR
ncbi:MAG: serine protease [Planctomycetaceae bacterium]|nr:serine protease [Planctomycetaceae bacterium]